MEKTYKVEHLDDIISNTKRINKIWEDLISYVVSKRWDGFGQIEYKTIDQYIRDKLLVLQYEFMVPVRLSDVRYIVTNCKTETSVDSYCNSMLSDFFENMNDEDDYVES